MSAYETFRPADVPWINMIPTHWETKRLKELLAERKESNNPVKTTDILSLTNTRGVIPYAQKGNIGNKSKENLENYKLAYPNDLVLNSMNVIIGSVGLSQYFGAVSPVYYMLYPRKNDNIRYFEYIFKLKTIQEYLKGLGNGILAIRMRIPMIKLNNVLLPVPPREEQDQIVRYLDWQVSKINKLISARKKQIVLLKEQKQAVINEAVTKGLDPAVPMKDSGVEWIGEIPAEWDVIPLKRQFSFGRGLPIKKSDLKEEGVPVICYGQVHAKTNTGVGLNDTLIRFVDPIYHMTNVQSLVHEGDFIFADTSEDHAGVGNCVYINTSDSIFAGYHTVILRTIEKGFSNYLAYLFLTDTWRSQLRSRVNGVKVYSITQGILKQSTVLIPPSDVQKKIVDYLDGRCSDIDRLIESINSKISLLVEYRTRLISDVVTGQIDVRDIEVPEFEYIADDVDDVSDDENTDLEEIMEEEE